MAVQLHCFSCNELLSYPDKVGLREECPRCRADVHVCKNCEFYDVKVYNECREPQAEVQREKDRANRCEYFRTGSRQGAMSQADALRAAAEALFKKSKT